MRLIIVVLAAVAISAGGCASWKEESMKEPKVTYDPVTGKEHYEYKYEINLSD